ncbi:iron-containing alcohol dehydrogenase, partial [Pseudomonas aeruginosa]
SPGRCGGWGENGGRHPRPPPRPLPPPPSPPPPPPSFPAAPGMEALTHAIEPYPCRVSTPISGGLALHATRLISQSLRPAVL